jgi:hypothetical protein
MKLKMEQFDIDLEKDETYRATQGVNDIYQNFKVTPFVYRSQNPNAFKLVLTWEFLLKNNETGKNIVKALGDHPFIVTLDKEDKHDRYVIENAVGVSYMHLQAHLFDFFKRVGLVYMWPKIDDKATATQILSHFPPADKR